MDNKKTITLDAANVRAIKCISGVMQSTPTEKVKEPFDYRRYRYDGVVFTIREEEGFYQELKDGTIWEAKLITGTEEVEVNGKPEVINRVEFDSFVTAKQQTNLVKMVGGIKRLEKELAAPITSITKEQLADALA